MNTATLPTWNLDSFFSGPGSVDYESSATDLKNSIRSLEGLFSALGVEDGELLATHPDTAKALADVISANNQVQEHARLLSAYLGCLVSADSRDALAQARQSELQILLVPLGKLMTRLTGWVGRMDIDGLCALDETVREHRFPLEKIHVASSHLMSRAEEDLASELRPTGSTAWSRLWGNVSSQLAVNVQHANRPEPIPMSEARALAYDPDRSIRMAAYKAELQTWKSVEVPLAACMNSIKGEVQTLSRLRNWNSPMEPALFSANIDRPTLEAMLSAVRRAFPDFHRYFRAKAKLVADPSASALPWFDLFAPIAEETKRWEYREAMQFVAEQFHTFSAKMGSFAEKCFADNWIDAPPRAGKVDGAFCMGMRPGESRILMNYKSSFGSVRTLAHELGHGYHNLCLQNRTPMQRETPMTLAETASIFCETVVNQAGIAKASPQEQLALLEGSLQGFAQTIVDVIGRMYFEQAVFDGRQKRELSADELCTLMLDAQEQSYGAGLDPNLRHPYMWAVKPHYYSGRSYYNFPYTFGLLFSLGLYSRYQAEGDSFKGAYDELLGGTGLADAASLAETFGIDIRSEAFWNSSLNTIRADIDRFCNLTSTQS